VFAIIAVGFVESGSLKSGYRYEDPDLEQVLSCTYLVRNVVRVDLALAEAYRVLRPGGRFLCLGEAARNLDMKGN
jgi:SAM-dependent methyltransferase